MKTPNLDRAAIRRLRRGIVPASHVLPLSVGLDANLDTISAELHRLAAGRGRACFIQGEWGAGKTHLLTAIRHHAINQGYGVAYLNVNGNSAALNQPQRFYHLIATRLQLRNADQGLAAILPHWTSNDTTGAKLQQWAVANANHSELASALLDVHAGTSLARAWAILMGTDLAAADYGYKRDKALHRMVHLGQCLNAIGNGGLVLALDEAETLEQLWNSRSRIGAYATLGNLASVGYVLPIFAITERFERQIRQDVGVRNILRQSALPIPAAQFLASWLRTEYPKLTTTTVTPQLAALLVERIGILYHQTYGAHDGTDLSALVRSWSTNPTRNPRSLIRHAVNALDIARAVRPHVPARTGARSDGTDGRKGDKAFA